MHDELVFSSPSSKIRIAKESRSSRIVVVVSFFVVEDRKGSTLVGGLEEQHSNFI